MPKVKKTKISPKIIFNKNNTDDIEREREREREQKLIRQVKTLTKRNQQLHQRIVEFQNNEADLHDTIEELKIRLDKTQESYENWQKHLQDDLDHACQELLKLEDDYEQEQQKNQQLTKQLTQKTNHWHQARQRLTKTRQLLKSFNQDNQLAQSHLQELTVSLSEQEQKINDKNNLISQLQGEITNRDQKISQQEQIIHQQAARIRELENKPPMVSVETQLVEKEIIKEVEKPVEKIITNTPLGECLIKIKKINLANLEQELNIKLSAETKSAIQSAQNYQELSKIRDQEIKKHLTSPDKKDKATLTTQNPQKVGLEKEERIIWLSLLVVSLIVIGGLATKLRKAKQKLKR